MSIEEIVEDWPTVKKRWEAWWQREIRDRVPVQVTAPRDGIPTIESEEGGHKVLLVELGAGVGFI